LSEKRGKESFWCWIVGFFVAFMPLYVLGFLGMTRRLNHTNYPDWNIWLYITPRGAVMIIYAIMYQSVQLFVCFRAVASVVDTDGS
ncbi:cytochrome o ubiquinol oxidase subunit I, partial [Pseudoalteromonas sp. S3785]|uniref:cbb3-type cytochrome c oxidase subunit I n=1 Tax=Pseudoalteromonas sp. S3785 TaxID=579545 RepID=UPI00127C5F5B